MYYCEYAHLLKKCTEHTCMSAINYNQGSDIKAKQCKTIVTFDTIVTSVAFESKDDPTQMTKIVIYNYILYYIQKTIHSKLICTNVHS